MILLSPEREGETTRQRHSPFPSPTLPDHLYREITCSPVSHEARFALRLRTPHEMCLSRHPSGRPATAPPRRGRRTEVVTGAQSDPPAPRLRRETRSGGPRTTAAALPSGPHRRARSERRSSRPARFCAEPQRAEGAASRDRRDSPSSRGAGRRFEAGGECPGSPLSPAPWGSPGALRGRQPPQRDGRRRGSGPGPAGERRGRSYLQQVLVHDLQAAAAAHALAGGAAGARGHGPRRGGGREGGGGRAGVLVGRCGALLRGAHGTRRSAPGPDGTCGTPPPRGPARLCGARRRGRRGGAGSGGPQSGVPAAAPRPGHRRRARPLPGAPRTFSEGPPSAGRSLSSSLQTNIGSLFQYMALPYRIPARRRAAGLLRDPAPLSALSACRKKSFVFKWVDLPRWPLLLRKTRLPSMAGALSPPASPRPVLCGGEGGTPATTTTTIKKKSSNEKSPSDPSPPPRLPSPLATAPPAAPAPTKAPVTLCRRGDNRSGDGEGAPPAAPSSGPAPWPAIKPLIKPNQEHLSGPMAAALPRSRSPKDRGCR